MDGTGRETHPAALAKELQNAIREELSEQMSTLDSSELLNRAEDYSTYVLMNEPPAYVFELAGKIESRLNTGYDTGQIAREITRMLAGVYRQHMSGRPEIGAG